jgi:cytidylate kinase
VIVAIDGGVASGKSAVGRRVADTLGLPFIDSGLMYRAIAALAVEEGVDPNDGAALARLAGRVRLRVDGRRVWADGRELTERVYDPALNPMLARVSKTAGVRVALVAQQRALARGGVVMAGRDIGTVVFPDADFKFFLEASLDERVRRRSAQFQARGEPVDPDAMRTEVAERDRADSERTVAPLRPAEDAIIVDTDRLDLEQTVEKVLAAIGGRSGGA